MKKGEAMMTPEEETGANGPTYASLTAGLLARKGEAVPAAAAFTAEAIAQHIPARRLAQEAERVLTQGVGPTPMDAVSEGLEDNAHEVEPSANFDDLGPDPFDEVGQEIFDGQLAARHSPRHDAFLDRERPNGGPSPRQRIADAQSLLDNGASLGLTPEPRPEETGTGSGVEQQPLQGDVSPESIPSLEDSEENWFEEIVSKAISEAEDHRVAEEPMPINEVPEPQVSPQTSQSPVPPSDGIVTDARIEGRATGGCGTKAAQVRDAIRSGGPRTAAKSAMRLDPRRFIRLSLAAQKLQINNQELMMAALDSYLDALDDEVFSDCSCMKKGLI